MIAAAPGRFAVASVAGGRDGAALADCAVKLGAEFAALADPAGYPDLKAGLAGSDIEAAAGPEAVVEAALRDADLVVSAIVGAAGLEPTFAAVSEGRTIALANKETLVCAGAAVMRMAKRAGATMLPVNSEHNALFQAIGARDPDTIEMMTITASGGPFREWTAERIAKATREEALAHPNWVMGPKVTINSAGLMNKGLELIEAHFLFGLPPDRLDVVVHPQSIVHGLVAFADGSLIAGMASPDMRTPIAHCLAYPDRIASGVRPPDLAALGAPHLRAGGSRPLPCARHRDRCAPGRRRRTDCPQRSQRNRRRRVPGPADRILRHRAIRRAHDFGDGGGRRTGGAGGRCACSGNSPYRRRQDETPLGVNEVAL